MAKAKKADKTTKGHVGHMVIALMIGMPKGKKGKDGLGAIEGKGAKARLDRPGRKCGGRARMDFGGDPTGVSASQQGWDNVQGNALTQRAKEDMVNVAARAKTGGRIRKRGR